MFRIRVTLFSGRLARGRYGIGHYDRRYEIVRRQRCMGVFTRCKEKKRLRKRVFGANGSTCAPRAKIATGGCLSPARSVFLRGGRVCACIFDRVQASRHWRSYSLE